MKRTLLLLATITGNIIYAQENFKVSGYIGNESAPGYVILNYKNDGVNILDTAILSNGSFSFEGYVSALTQARLHVSPDGEGKFKPKNVKTIFLEKGDIKVNSADDAANAIVSGTPSNNDYQYYNNLKTNSSTSSNSKIEPLEQFLKEKQNSPLITFLVNEYLGKYPKLNLLESVYAILPENIKKEEQGKNIASKIYSLKNTSINSIAPDFQQQDTSGRMVSLKDFRGKYVLVEFWASWCGPCRKESPNIVKTYNTYKDKNFTIVSISLDNKKEKWLEAINKDGLTGWTHLSDLQGWKNSIAQLYSVIGVPTNYLLDPSGKIIAVNLRGENLPKKLSEIL